MGIMVEIQAKDGHKMIELNRRRTIRERCLNCSGWSWKEVAECTLKDCQLHPFRTGVGRQDSKKRTKAIRDYCAWCMSTEQSARCVVRDCPLWCYRKSTVERPNIPLYDAIQERIAVNE
jgi:hypothetical protein